MNKCTFDIPQVQNKAAPEDLSDLPSVPTAQDDDQSAVPDPAAATAPTLAPPKPSRRRGSRLQSILERRESKIRDIAEKISPDLFDPQLLRSWYVLDRNVVPPVYRLQKIR